MHSDAFGGTRFVNDAFEQATNCGVRQRALVIVLGILDDFLFAIRLIQRQIGLLLEFANFQRALGTFVEQFDQLVVDFIDAAAEVGEGHGRGSGRHREARSCCQQRLGAEPYVEILSDKVGIFDRTSLSDVLRMTRNFNSSQLEKVMWRPRGGTCRFARRTSANEWDLAATLRRARTRRAAQWPP